MLVHGRPMRTIWPAADGAVEIVDQTLLPHAVEIVRLTTLGDAVGAIATMQRRVPTVVTYHSGDLELTRWQRKERQR